MKLKKLSILLSSSLALSFFANNAISFPGINSEYLYVGKLNGNYIASAGDYNRTLNLLEDLQGLSDIPSFVLGGALETDASLSHNTSQNTVLPSAGYDGTNSSDVWLDTARLVLLANANNMFHAQARVDFQNSPAKLKDASIIIGDLDKSPWYGIVGKEYVHFGDFIENSVYTDPLTFVYFKPSALPEASLGYHKGDFDFDITAFQGVIVDSSVPNSYKPQKYSGQFATHISYNIPVKAVTWNIGVGFINDIRNSQSGLTDLVALNGGKLPAVDISTSVTQGNLSLAAEYDQLLRSAKESGDNAVSNNTKPAAMHVQADYNINWKKPINVFAGFSNTFGMKNILAGDNSSESGANKNQYTAGVRVSISDQLSFGLEYANVGQYVWDKNNNPTDNISRYNIFTLDGNLIF